MQRKQGLVPVGEAFGGLGGPVKALRKATPQALHHFTQADQVDELVGASEEDAELGFMARLMALCSLPRTNPGDQKEYKRVNGPYTLYMNALADNKLPFGNLPRLLMAWVSTEAVRTQSRELILGSSLSEFMRKLGMAPVGGGATGARTRLRNQMKRLFHCTISLIYEGERGEQFVTSSIADRGEFWWDPKRPDEPVLWESKIELGEKFFPGDHQPPHTAGHEHPEGSQAVLAGPGSVSVAYLPGLHAETSAAALVAAPLPPVRGGPGQGGQ